MKWNNLTELDIFHKIKLLKQPPPPPPLPPGKTSQSLQKDMSWKLGRTGLCAACFISSMVSKHSDHYSHHTTHCPPCLLHIPQAQWHLLPSWPTAASVEPCSQHSQRQMLYQKLSPPVHKWWCRQIHRNMKQSQYHTLNWNAAKKSRIFENLKGFYNYFVTSII